jgi:hypothetical protein
VRAIGVSNFTVEHLTGLLEQATVAPAVNQIEVHPYFAQPDVQAFDAEHGILTQAWSPIGGITFYRDGSHGSTLEDPVIGQIGQSHGKTPAQVMLRAGTCSKAGPSSRSRPAPNGSLKTSTSSTSSSPMTSWPRSTPSTRAGAAVRNRATSRSRASAARSPRTETAGRGRGAVDEPLVTACDTTSVPKLASPSPPPGQRALRRSYQDHLPIGQHDALILIVRAPE